MNKQQADELIVQYLPKIYGFAMKKAFSYQEAEELSSDIVAEVYLSMLSAKEIVNILYNFDVCIVNFLYTLGNV